MDVLNADPFPNVYIANVTYKQPYRHDYLFVFNNKWRMV